MGGNILNCFKEKHIVFVQGFPRLACLRVGSLGPNQFCWGPLLDCCCPHRTSVHVHTHKHTHTHSHTHTHTHRRTLNKWLGPPPSGQRSRCWPVHLIYHGSPLRSAPLDPVQHLFSHQGMLCWRGVAMPLYRLALPSWGSRKDEVWDSQWLNVSCN